jgi:TPR repeat protein
LRAPAAIAHRHEERAGFAWILRQFGASEATLDRLAQGDLNELMADLKRQASRRNATATNTLGWLARRCSTLRSPEVLHSYNAAQKAQAQMLSPSDANWLTSLIDEDETREGALSTACASEINQVEIEALVSARAEQGDAGSKWLESESASNAIELRTLLRQAAAGGFPEAQYELARQLLSSQDPQWHLSADPSPMDLLREAAVQLPDARANLAICEFKGCHGTTPDPMAAVQDARTAAQSGQPAAMLSLSATLPVGALEPDEGEAWQVFEAVLELQGCRVNNHYVDWLKGINAALASPAVTPQVQALANQYWQAYGAAAESQLGCGP